MTDAFLKHLHWHLDRFTSLGMTADIGAPVLIGLWALYCLQGRLLEEM